MPTDEDVARWAYEQNRGVPAWEALSDDAKRYWWDRYMARMLDDQL